MSTNQSSTTKPAAAAKPAAKKSKRTFKTGHSSMTKRSMRKWSWLFIGPVFVSFIFGFLWPFGQGIYLSFCGKFSTISDAKLKGFDNYVVIFDCQGQQQVIYKHAISTIAPSRPVPLLDAEAEKSE